MNDADPQQEKSAADGLRHPLKQAPILFLHGIDRHYRQGDVTLHILQGRRACSMARPIGRPGRPLRRRQIDASSHRGPLEHPDGGDVYVDQIATSGLSDAERTRIRRTEIGFIYQFHHLLMEFSALENVIMPQMVRGLSRAKRPSAPPIFWPISVSRTA